MKARIKFALLICDTPHPTVVAEHGDYLKIYTEFLNKSVPARHRNDVEVIVDGYDVRDLVFPSADAFDGTDAYTAIVLTGSAASAYEDKEWIHKTTAYVAQIASEKPSVKIIGICFGHQLVSQAFGLQCVPNNGVWEIGITPVDLTEAGKAVFGVPTLHIEQMHHDHVPLSDSSESTKLQLLGSTGPCVNQGLVLSYPSDSPLHSTDVHRNIHVLTVQGHPEFNPRIVSLIVDARLKTGAMTPELVERWRATEEDRQRRGIGDEGISVFGVALWKMFGF